MIVEVLRADRVIDAAALKEFRPDRHITMYEDTAFDETAPICAGKLILLWQPDRVVAIPRGHYSASSDEYLGGRVLSQRDQTEREE